MGAFTRVDNGTGVGLSVPFVHDDFAMLADTGLVPIRWGREELELAISINVTDLDLVNEGVSLLIQLDDLGLGTLSGWVVYGDHTAVVGGEDTKIQHTGKGCHLDNGDRCLDTTAQPPGVSPVGVGFMIGLQVRLFGQRFSED